MILHNLVINSRFSILIWENSLQSKLVSEFIEAKLNAFYNSDLS